MCKFARILFRKVQKQKRKCIYKKRKYDTIKEKEADYMKKILCIALAVMLVLSMCTVSLAANISSFKLTKVQRIGLKGDTMRFVVWWAQRLTAP